LNAGSAWPAAAIPRDKSSEADEAALGLTGVPGLAPVSAPGAGDGLGVDGVSVAGAALGLTGVPGFVAVSPPVAGAALGLAARACASLLQMSKSAGAGAAASAIVAKVSRLTPERTSISTIRLRMIRLSFSLDLSR